MYYNEEERDYLIAKLLFNAFVFLIIVISILVIAIAMLCD